YAPDAAVQDVFQGWIAVVIKPSDLFSVTDNFTGLGKTGEILLVIANETGHAVILNSVRHSINEGYWQLEGTEQSADVKAAIAGQDAHFTAHVRDYRGEAVWSVVRYVEGLEWGLIVKVDVAEEREYVGVLRDAMTDLAMALSAFAIVGGTLLGIYLARPIQHLASVVHKLRDGHLNVTAEVRGDDEVAYMAQSLNHLIEDLRAEAKASGKDSSDA
ncbi:MAG: HAMP domain-containing protein, partial [Gammaproteobacteria bacterium]|nr:HAMP domain-containing protein [Gammaproteobacteria bacterium]